MNGQPNQGLASLTGGMGGSPTLGGAPQTPPMPQGGAQKPPQQAPQGQLDPKLLDALSKIAALKVREEESKARARILASMNQGNEGTVVEQLDKQNMEATKKELVDKLSGGVKQAGQMSAQPQGQPMSGGIAAAPGANQAAQPEAMAAGGIVAFDEGAYIDPAEYEEPGKERPSTLKRGLGSIKTGLSKAAKLAASPYVLGAELMTDSKEAGAGSDYKNGRPITPEAVRKLRESGYFEEKGIGSLNPFGKSPDEKEREMLRSAVPDPVGPNITPEQLAANARQRQNIPAATLQNPSGPRTGTPPGAPRPAATLQAPTAPAPDAFQQKLQSGISGLLDTDETVAATKAREEYQRMVPQDQGLVDQRKKDAAALRAALEKQNAPLDWSDRLSAMAQGAMGGVRGGSNWMSEGVAGGAKLRGLEAAYAAKQAENLGVLKGMSEEDYNRDIALKEKLYGVGSEAAKAAKAAREKAIQSGVIMAGNQTQERTAYAQMANDLVRQGMSNASAKEIAGMNAAASAAATAAMRESNTLSKQQTILSSLRSTRETVRENIAKEFIPRYNTVNPLLTGKPDSDSYKNAVIKKQKLDEERDAALKIATAGLDSQIEEIHSQMNGGTSGFKVVGKRQQ